VPPVAPNACEYGTPTLPEARVNWRVIDAEGRIRDLHSERICSYGSRAAGDASRRNQREPWRKHA
jgi:hypothetical protein